MPVSPFALTSLESLKAHLGQSLAVSDALLTSVIDRSSQAIERFCNRPLRRRSIRDWCRPSMPYATSEHARQGHIRLRSWPIARVDRVAAAREAVLHIWRDADIANASALVSVGESDLRLLDVSDSGTTATVTLTFADHPSIASLAAAIAAVPAWHAQLGEQAVGGPSHWLRPTPVLDARRRPALLAATTPHSVSQIDSESGVVWLDSCLDGEGLVLVEYEAGYDPVPADLEHATLRLCTAMLPSFGTTDTLDAWPTDVLDIALNYRRFPAS